MRGHILIKLGTRGLSESASFRRGPNSKILNLETNLNISAITDGGILGE